MHLPQELQTKIEQLCSGIPFHKLCKASEALTRQYRMREGKTPLKPLRSQDQFLAYLVARFPATYAVALKVLQEVQRLAKSPLISLLDVGAGPATLFLAAKTLFPLEWATLIERSPEFIELGKELCSTTEGIFPQWLCQDLKKDLTLEPHDLVTVSYVLNELNEQDRLEVLAQLWKLTKKFLVIIEPGTKPVFESIKAMRQFLIAQGAHLVAPCPHFKKCPLQEPDWCHFSARIERTSSQRKIKEARLNYEDEKFSYLLFSRDIPKVTENCHSRVLRHPYRGSGYIKLQLCTKNGIEQKTITKKNKEEYLKSKKIEWGDTL